MLDDYCDYYITNNSFFVFNDTSMMEMWRGRVGIEPTGDTPCRPLGFEDREGHQFPIRPHEKKSPSHTLHCVLSSYQV